MEKDLKQLLLKDLCARLPYNVKVRVLDECGYEHISTIDGYLFGYFRVNETEYDIEEIKPYLRPMSSMTDEEWEDFNNYRGVDGILKPLSNDIDWLNKHHFDYRGLIEKGLALEAPKGMYEY